MQDEPKGGPKRKADFWTTMKAVLWSFFGIRKKIDHERDAAQLDPLHIVLAGLLAAAVLIVALLMIVKSVVTK
ncbi:MAG TPA: DUF2970 domain-containing protein [Burkholderiaceae bacterium]|jgi:preprotein translocase subunit Sec61beta|nr:DUF2970 domain-containing protein [Burkholderiaceae bacterium]